MACSQYATLGVKHWFTCKALAYIGLVIRAFRSKALRAFAESGDASRLSVQNPERVRRILLALNAATAPEQLNIPGLRFHGVTGREKGRFALSASGNYRITSGWDGEDATDVDLEDYH